MSGKSAIPIGQTKKKKPCNLWPLSSIAKKFLPQNWEIIRSRQSTALDLPQQMIEESNLKASNCF